PIEGRKYQWLKAYGGPRNTALCHVPIHTRSAETVLVTEGALKADIIRRLSLTVRPCPPEPWAVVGLPGVSCWARAVPVLRALGARLVALAFDADLLVNDSVRLALAQATAGLVAAGFRVGVLSWDERCRKGLDDALLAGGAPIYLTTLLPRE